MRPGTSMQFGVHLLLPATAPVARWNRAVVAAEAAGFSQIGVGDVQTVTLEATVAMTVIALASTSARFGPIVSNPVTRHPAVTAAAMASLARLSGGRAFLAIGTGNSAVRNLALRAARLDDVEEYVTVVRDLWTRGVATYHGDRCVLPWAVEPPTRVPVLLGASGPRALRVAGRIADGVICGGGVSPGKVESTLQSIAEAARQAGRSVDELDVWFQACVAVDDVGGAAADTMLAGMASREFRTPAAIEAAPPEMRDPLRRFCADYDYADHISSGAANARRLVDLGLRDFLADRWLIEGSPQQIAARLAELRARGVRRVHVAVVGGEVLDLIHRLGREVLPVVSSAAHA